MRLVIPLRHPVAERDSASLKLLRQETLVSLDSGVWPGFAAQIDQVLGRHDVVPQRRIEVKSVSTAASLIAAERGVALICESLTHGLNSVAVIPIEERDAVAQYWVIYRRDYSSAEVAPVLEVLDAIAAEEGVAALA
jgi:DNA-binding transcriptional LysR family regulator